MAHPTGKKEGIEAPAAGRRADRHELLLALRWPLAIFGIVALLVVGGLGAYLLTLRQAAAGVGTLGDAAGRVADRAERLASSFFTGDVTERFVSSMPQFDRSGVGRLEVASMVLTERLTRADERRAFFDVVPLGTTTVEIEVPVTYRYHVPVSGEWRLEIHGPVCLVLAPPLEPTLPPAIHTDRLRTRSQEDLLRFDAGEQMAELQRNLTPRLSRRASSDAYLELVRDEARRGVADFVRSWLLDQEFWVDDRFATIRVVFADETPTADLEAPPAPQQDPG